MPMLRPLCLCLAIAPTACTANQPVQGMFLETVDLTGLPLSSESVRELSAVDVAFQDPAFRRACSSQDINVLALSLVMWALMADIEDEWVTPLTSAEEARVNALRQRWQDEVGDEGDLSPGCQEVLETLVDSI